MTQSSMPEGMKGVLGWVLGVAIIAFILLIMVIIFGNLAGNVGFSQTSTIFHNETINLTEAGEIPASADNRVNPSLSSITMTNATTGVIITAPNYTLTTVTFSNATITFADLDVNISATVTYDTQAQIDSDAVILNYTEGAVNTSGQLPTVGTIIGIAILLLILIGLLIFTIRKMMGLTGSTLGSNKGSQDFSGSSREFS